MELQTWDLQIGWSQIQRDLEVNLLVTFFLGEKIGKSKLIQDEQQPDISFLLYLHAADISSV